MKKIYVLLLTLLFAAAPQPGAAASAVSGSPPLSAASCILVDAGTGTVLYARNASEERLIASTTKVMTALVVLENAETDEVVEIKNEYVGIEGSSMYLRAGERLTVRELLYGLLMASGNDAAVALACHTAGSVTRFAEMMNAAAQALGCVNSSFKNPHGLDAAGHYSSARDLALITAAALRHKIFCDIVSTKTAAVAGRSFTNHNKLLWNVEGAIGVKTGYTRAAGRSLVSCAERNGMRLICVTLNAPDDWEDHRALYSWGFDRFKLVEISPDLQRYELPVITGQTDTVLVQAQRGYQLLAERSDNVEVSVTLPRFVYAPVVQNARAGALTVTKNGVAVTEIPLVYKTGAALDESAPLTGWEKFLRALPFGGGEG